MPSGSSPTSAPTAAPEPPPAPSQPPPAPTPAGRRHGRARRAGQRAFGVLLLARFALTAVFTVVLVVSGVWAAWDDASRALAPGDDERGTITLHACDDEACTGTFAPRGAPPGEDRREVTMPQPLGREPGERLSVALRPGTAEVVRTGAAGALYAALPLTGALLLASVIVAGGLRLYRVAAVTVGVAVTALLATFVLW